MTKKKNLPALILFSAVVLVGIASALVSSRQVTSTQTPPSDVDFSKFPIKDLDSKEILAPTQKAQRDKRGKKFQIKGITPISENSDGMFVPDNWAAQLPPIPTAESAAVVIGKVVSGEAHLTADKTAVYSEFTIEIDTIVKNDDVNVLDNGEELVVQRAGGRVRMPSGKVFIAWTNQQRMPTIGSRHVLFLTHSYKLVGDMGADFYLLTGYELKDGRVTRLDGALSATKYSLESEFFKDLFSSTVKPNNK